MTELRLATHRASSIGLLTALSIVLLAARPAPAAERGNGVDPFYGAFGTEVPIEIPSFHAVEPTIKLSYSSTGRNGFVGVGWALAASSYIDRVSSSRGSPNYDSSDIFRLDGQQLVSCTTLGGTHCTKIQNYQRIKQDTGANKWYVWRKDGTKATYTAQFTTSKGTFRWALKTLVDTHGNTVTFNYWCDGSNECYLDNVSYNNNTVTLYRETRPDVFTYATGAGMAKVRYRLKTIDVKVNGSRARAYKLTYTTSGSTGRSLLSTVTQYGKNATLSSGTITGGTHLPAMTVSAPSSGETYPTSLGLSGSVQKVGTYDPINSWTQFWLADVTGDALPDLVYLDDAYGTNGYRVMKNTGNGFANPVNWGAYDSVNSWTQFWVKDMNADGKADLLYLDNAYTTNGYRVMLSTGSSFANPVNWGAYDSVNSWSSFWVEDVTGDALPDLVYLDNAYTTNGYRVMRNTGSGFANPVNWGAYDSVNSWTQVWMRDMNGDGMSDLLYLDNAYTTNGYRVMLSTGSSFANPVNWGAYDTVHSWSAVWVEDVNGDGRPDLVYLDDAYNTNGYRVMLNNGAGFETTANWGAYDSVNSWTQVWMRDMNGDGMSDLLYLDNAYTTNGYRVMLSTGTGFASPANYRPFDSVSSWSGFYVSDITGDDLPELFYLDDAASTNGYRMYENTGDSDLVTSINNGLGGTTTVGYTPSSAWDNTYLPLGMIIQTVSSVTTGDGRGNSATTSYQYQGGLWSDSERRFLGFRKATGVIDAAGNYTETYYHQHVGCIAKPEVTYYRSATGSIYSYSTYEYQENASAPYTSLLTDRWDYACEGGSHCQRVLVQLGYDIYGNVIEAKEYGNYDATGDERTTISGFYKNTSAYIVGKKGYENVYQGIGTAGRLMKRELRYFDGQSSYTSPPVVGDMTKRRRWNDQTGAYFNELFSYDQYGNLTEMTDALGYSQTTAYDGIYHVYPTQECDALGHCRNQGYDYVLGKVTSESDANGNTATRTYDVLGRPRRLTRPGGSYIERQYTSWGSPTAQKVRTVTSDGTADGLWEDAYFDGMQREYKRVRDGGATQLTEYFEGTTRVWKQSLWYDPSSENEKYVVRSYDGSGRVIRVTAPDGSHADTSYAICYNAGDADFAAARACTTRTDELGHAVREAVDGFGQVVNRSEWNGGAEARTHYSYDVLGREIEVKDALGNTRSQTWDSLGNLLSVCDPDLGCWSYGYDATGRRTSATDAKGQTTTMSYDGLGRRLTETAADQSVVSFTYDQSGHGSAIGTEPTSVTWNGGSDSRSYDAAGRVTSATRCVLGQCETVGWSYDNTGRLASVSYPGGEVVSYGYDAAGNLASVSGYATSLTHNARGQLTRIDYANGTYQTYDYDADRTWLTSSTVKKSSTKLYQASYQYDAAARVIATTSTTDSWLNRSYAYDDLNRVTAVIAGCDYAQNRIFDYDKLGRITNKSNVGPYSYGTAHDHAATKAGGQSYTYDLNGNMTGGAGRTLEWDAKNRLATVTKNGLTTSFGYDPNGQRTYKTTGTETTRYFGKLVERSASGQLQTYVYAGTLLVAKKAGTTKLYYHTDHLGSVQLITNASGGVARSYDYAPFGSVGYDSGNADNARGFGGHDFDAETGLLYMNARYYDPVIGRFISADTLVPDPSKPQALDRYAFAYNNPISNADPTGHAPVVVAVVAAAAVASTTTSVVIAAIAIAGAVCTVAGYVLKDPTLMTIGGVLLGFATGYMGPLLGGGLAGGLLGAAVAAATSPLSPLDPGLKQAIGWAYAIACFTASQIKASETMENIEAGARQQAANEGLTVDQVRDMGFKDPNRAMMSAHLISKDAVGYTMRDALNAAIKSDNLGLGMVGPGSGTLTSILDNTFGRIPSVQLHGIVHDAYGLAFNSWGVGPGYGYSGKLAPFMSSGSPMTGQATGIFRNTFLTPVSMGDLDAISGSLGHQLEAMSWDWANA